MEDYIIEYTGYNMNLLYLTDETFEMFEVNKKYLSSNIAMQTLLPRQLHRSVVETKCVVSRLPPQTQIKIRFFFSQNVALVLD